ncbi:MAG TPA: hypothetical protein VGH38_28750 [Bryobacteraceae bacterium]
MPCDTKLKAGQTITQRKQEITEVIAKVVSALTAGRIKVKIGPTGGVAFEGLADTDRANVTDACVFRRIMAGNSATAKMAIQRAETLAGRPVNRQSVAAGHHSHDGGVTWHHHRG